MAKGGEFILPSDQLASVFTVNNLTDEQKMIRDTAREVVAEKITSDDAIKLIESKDRMYQRSLMKSLADIGFLGIEIPEEYGGTDLGIIVSTIVAEEVARQGSFATTMMAHTGIGTLPIKFFGTEEQKKKYLPKLVSGEWIASYSLTEGTAGSDAASVKTRAIWSEGNTYNISGEKIFVTNGGFADLYIIFAQLEDLGLTAFIVPRETRNFTVGKEEHKMGIQGSSTVTLVLDNVRIPRSNLLGEEGKGFKIAVNILNIGRFKLGAACLGAGKMCLEESLKYSKERKQFGQPIYSFGAIRQKLARMAAKNYAMESIVYRTAGLLQDAIHGVDANDSKAVLKAIGEFSIECSLVKVFCSEALDFVVDENVQIHGGNGYCEELPPARHYRDSRINRIFEGTNEINRLLAVGMLLKRAAMGKLPLLSAIKKVVEESMTPALQSEPEEFSQYLLHHLNNAKKAVLLASGTAYQKFGLKLEEHQIVLLNLADCLINVFVAESVAARDPKPDLARLIFDDFMFNIERSTREVVAMCSEGDEQRTQLAMIRRLLKFTPENQENLCNSIVENL